MSVLHWFAFAWLAVAVIAGVITAAVWLFGPKDER